MGIVRKVEHIIRTYMMGKPNKYTKYKYDALYRSGADPLNI